MKIIIHSVILLALLSTLSACDSNQPETGSVTETLPIPNTQKSSESSTEPLSELTKLPGFTPPKTSQLPTPPNFKDFPAGSQRKAAFFNYMAPLIHTANQQILVKRARIKEITNHFKITKKDQNWLKQEAEFYGVAPFDPLNPEHQKALLSRVDKIPTSLALAQAANESAWGTSRFARKANNYFGQWCFTKGCGLVPAKRTEGAIHEVRAFKHPYNSIVSYLHNLNTHATYQKLRTLRAQARQKNQSFTGIELAEGLVNYSARKHEYVKELQSMIRYNKLSRFNQKDA